MTDIYRESTDADLSVLYGKTIAILGYGNQGKAQALNLRDSGLNVIIGNRNDEYKKRAIEDGFVTYSIVEATKKATIVFVLLPDEITQEIYNESVVPNLKEQGVIVCAHGYNIAFGLIEPSPVHDLLLIAPRMIGVGVRERYLTGEGFYSFVHVNHDASGKAKQILLALCKALGTLKKGAIDVTFKQEAVLDLFNEQGFGPAFGQVLLNSIYTLVDAGYPEEAVLVEMFMSEEMAYTYEKMAQVGLVKQTEFHSQTSQYGAMSRGIKFATLPIKKKMKSILKNIESGGFAREWQKKRTKILFKFLKYFAMRTRINRLETRVREKLSLSVNQPYQYESPSMEIEQLEEIKEEIKEFELFYSEY